MSGLLMFAGALTLAGGILRSLMLYMTNDLLPGWVPLSYLVGGAFGSLIWFALAGIVRRLDEIQVMVGKPAR